MDADHAFRAPWWLPGGHVQTIWSALWARAPDVPVGAWRRERWTTPDGDFIDVDHGPQAQTGPGRVAVAARQSAQLVLFHGLEGSSASPYARAFAQVAAARGWSFAVPHFRGCSGEINLAPRAYHSGDHEEVAWILGRLKARAPEVPLMAVGISLGGNALMRWAQESGASAGATVAAVAAVSSPLDLAASGGAIDRGLNRTLYARMFLKTMRAKAEAKWRQFPGLFDLGRVRAARTLYEFDDVFTGPLHGFAGTRDYWSQAAAKPRMRDIRIPALALNALNDPFVPAASLPRQREVGAHVTLWQPAQGGHVGFCRSGPSRPFPGDVMEMPTRLSDWLGQAAGVGHG